jgi:hypothetical protein
VTVALTAPKYTMLVDGVLLKFAPVIASAVPTGPLVGENDAMVGD